MLPINDIITKSTNSFSTANGYALYYKESLDEDSRQVVTSIHYKVSTGTASVPSINKSNMRFVNILLSPSSIQDVSIKMRRNDEDNVSKLNDMSILMLVDVPTINSFKDLDKDQNIEFNVASSEEGIMTMTMISKFVNGNIVERPIVDEGTALIWQFKTPASYVMYDRTPLLLQSVNSGIKLGTHSLYFAFCRYGDEYAFLKIVSSKPASAGASAPGILLTKILDNTCYVMEMYFCYSV